MNVPSAERSAPFHIFPTMTVFTTIITTDTYPQSRNRALPVDVLFLMRWWLKTHAIVKDPATSLNFFWVMQCDNYFASYESYQEPKLSELIDVKSDKPQMKAQTVSVACFYCYLHTASFASQVSAQGAR